MLNIEYQGQIKRDYKLAIKRGRDMSLLEEVITMLANREVLPPEYEDHILVASRKYKKMRECHIQPDWLLIYRIIPQTSTLQLIRTGSHSDLF